jgi:hypothetical protein
VLSGKVPEIDQIHLEDMQAIFSRRKSSYHKLLIQTALVKERETQKWKNIFTKITPLAKENLVEEKTLDYEGFLVASIIMEANEFYSIVDHLITHGKLRFRGCPEVQFEGTCSGKRGNYIQSSYELFGIGWPANIWNFSPTNDFQGRPQNEPLLEINKPSFPDGLAAIKSVIGYDLVNRDGYLGCVLILLPNYRARIMSLKIGSKETTIEVAAKDASKLDLIGKLYCESGKEILTKDIFFNEERQVIKTGFKPESLYFYLLHREDGELIDQRSVSLWWLSRPLSNDVTIEIAGEDVRQMIARGENDKVEFKRQIGKEPYLDEFIETVVAFANSSGGAILIGVDDNGKINGVEEENLADRIDKVLRSHCDPPIPTEISTSVLDGENVLVVQVREGGNKPYVLRDKGVYVRSGATDRLITTRAELDEFYEQRARQHTDTKWIS